MSAPNSRNRSSSSCRFGVRLTAPRPRLQMSCSGVTRCQLGRFGFHAVLPAARASCPAWPISRSGSRSRHRARAHLGPAAAATGSRRLNETAMVKMPPQPWMLTASGSSSAIASTASSLPSSKCPLASTDPAVFLQTFVAAWIPWPSTPPCPRTRSRRWDPPPASSSIRAHFPIPTLSRVPERPSPAEHPAPSRRFGSKTVRQQRANYVGMPPAAPLRPLAARPHRQARAGHLGRSPGFASPLRRRPSPPPRRSSTRPRLPATREPCRRSLRFSARSTGR